MREWTRLRRACTSVREKFLHLAKKQHLQHLAQKRLHVAWLTVTKLYTREQQIRWDEINADSIKYLAIGTRVLPFMSPEGIDSAGWLFVLIETTTTLGVDCGWIHPEIVGLPVVHKISVSV